MDQKLVAGAGDVHQCFPKLSSSQIMEAPVSRALALTCGILMGSGDMLGRLQIMDASKIVSETSLQDSQ